MLLKLGFPPVVGQESVFRSSSGTHHCTAKYNTGANKVSTAPWTFVSILPSPGTALASSLSFFFPIFMGSAPSSLIKRADLGGKGVSGMGLRVGMGASRSESEPEFSEQESGTYSCWLGIESMMAPRLRLGLIVPIVMSWCRMYYPISSEGDEKERKRGRKKKDGSALGGCRRSK